MWKRLLRLPPPAAILLVACELGGPLAPTTDGGDASADLSISILGPPSRDLRAGETLVLQAEAYRRECNADGQECTWTRTHTDVTWWVSDERTVGLAEATESSATVRGIAEGTADVEARHQHLRARVRVTVRR